VSAVNEYFGLERSPFSTTPDPAFAYATREHKAALAKIAYYVEERRGIFLLMGQIGTGKTTISQLALNGWRSQPERFVATHITDPSPRTPAAFMRLILASFGLETPRNLLELKALFRSFLVEQYKAGKIVVVLIDEAQTIYPTNLDTIQAMTNEQTQKDKLVQVVLLAQPNFEYKLTHKPALRSRIAGGSTLNPLTLEDAIDLLRHRMEVAGGDFDAVFTPETHKALYNATNGIPRDLCILCDATLIEAYSANSKIVTLEIIEAAHAQLGFKGWGATRKKEKATPAKSTTTPKGSATKRTKETTP
jgi:general secretion pathway protein A